jgi:hypothetical protein
MIVSDSPNAASPPAPGRSSPLHPSLWRAWGAIWLFKWKSQMTWRRLGRTLVMLSVLPLLVWSTVQSPGTWVARDQLQLGNVGWQVGRISGRMARSRIALDTNQEAQLRIIFTSEYEQAQKDYRAIVSPETSVEQQRELVHACHRRIMDRARQILDRGQMAQLDTLDNEFVNSAESAIGEPAWNRTAPFYRWLIDFYFFIVMPFSCVWACGGLIRDELATDTLGFLVTRPIKRANLVILKYLAEVCWLEIVVLAEGLLLMGAGSLRKIPEMGLLTALFLAVQFLAVPAWSALGLLLGQLTKRYLPLALVYGLIVELGIGAIPTNINTLSLMRHLKTLLSHNQELQSLYEWTGTGVWLPVGALLVASALFVTLASLLFTFREYHANTEMQK